jgi:4a-hydroxytetrahydrobiopterin dehydratase
MRHKIDEIKHKLNSRFNWDIGSVSMSNTFVFDQFSNAISFVNQIATIAEKMDHHPDIDIRYNKVKITLSTHSERGVTEKDIDLAHKIDALFDS